MTDDSQLVELMNGALGSTIPTARNMGVRVVEARRGFAAATVPVEGNGNHFGVIYAGVQFTVAEILGGIIALSTFDSSTYFPLVKNVDISFVGMARSELRAQASLDDETIARIEAEAAERGKSDFTRGGGDRRRRQDGRHHSRAVSAARDRQVAVAGGDFASRPGSAPHRQPACSQWDRRDQSESEHSSCVPMLFGHGERHQQHRDEVGGIRRQVEIKESRCASGARAE